MNIYKINIPKSVIILTIFAVVLNILRILIWGKLSFIYITWNIFLAFIPFIISSLILYFFKEGKIKKYLFVIGIFLWIIFIPNAPYIITDFVHLGEIRSIPLLYDIVLLFTSSCVGLILGFNSFYHIEQIIYTKYNKNISNIIMGIIILMISFGVYLGRFLRFNSWDVFINHTSLIKNIWKNFSQSNGYIEVFFYTGLLFFFLFLFYKAWKYSELKQ